MGESLELAEARVAVNRELFAKALGSLNDPAHNDKMIDKFYRELANSLKNSTA